MADPTTTQAANPAAMSLYIEQPLSLATMEDVVKFADIAHKSGVFQDIRNAQQAVIKIVLGRDLGLGPIAAMKGIKFDKRGEIVLMASLQTACLKRHGYTWTIDKHDDTVCAITLLKGSVVVGKQELTMAQAVASKMNMQWDDDLNNKQGGWKEKAIWRSYPSDMLFARVITRTVRRFAPEVTSGVAIYDPDELTPLEPGAVIEHDPNEQTGQQAGAQAGDAGQGQSQPTQAAGQAAKTPTRDELRTAWTGLSAEIKKIGGDLAAEIVKAHTPTANNTDAEVATIVGRLAKFLALFKALAEVKEVGLDGHAATNTPKVDMADDAIDDMTGLLVRAAQNEKKSRTVDYGLTIKDWWANHDEAVLLRRLLPHTKAEVLEAYKAADWSALNPALTVGEILSTVKKMAKLKK